MKSKDYAHFSFLWYFGVMTRCRTQFFEHREPSSLLKEPIPGWSDRESKSLSRWRNVVIDHGGEKWCPHF